MLPIVDTPIIEFAVREAVASGIDDIIIITGRGKRALEDHLDRSPELEYHLAQNGKKDLLEDISCEFGADIHFIRQKAPLGLGHAVLQAAKHIGDEPFAVLLADEIYEASPPCLAQIIETFGETGEPALGLRVVPDAEVSRYGIAEGETSSCNNVLIRSLIEKPSPSQTTSRLAVCGRYVLTSEVFTCIEATQPGVNGEIQLTDALQMLLGKRRIYGRLISGIVYDVGDRLGFLQATVEFALRRPDLGAAFAQFLAMRCSVGTALSEVATTAVSTKPNK
jgi:UTP--glucose-1-phosphate uridylyltransferase